MTDKWIQEAIKRPGSLKRWLKKNQAKVKRATGMSPFTKTGKVNIRALVKFRKTKAYEKTPKRIKQKINLAINLSRPRKKK